MCRTHNCSLGTSSKYLNNSGLMLMTTAYKNVCNMGGNSETDNLEVSGGFSKIMHLQGKASLLG